MALTNWSPQGTVAWMGFWLEFNLIGHKSSLFWFTFYFRPVYQIHDNQVFIFLYWAKYSDMSINRNIPSARWPCSCLHRASNWFNASLPINWAFFWGMSIRFPGNWLAWLFFWLQDISHKPLVQDHFTSRVILPSWWDKFSRQTYTGSAAALSAPMCISWRITKDLVVDWSKSVEV